MLIKDRIYGEIDISGVISELIETKPFQRLKNISQDGASHFIQTIRDITRYEHSIGVWYLTKLFSRSIEEQIAALLHDLPHTAFSHVIDFVVNDPTHEFHERFTKKIVMESEIPIILNKHKINLEKVLAKENFPLLDNSLPDISVDRWDYFMRDGYNFGLIPRELIDLFLENIKVKNEQFYFSNKNLAGTFAVLFMNCSRLVWLDPDSHGSFFLLAGAIKLALNEGIITEDDFFLTDGQLWNILQKAKNTEIKKMLNRLSPKRNFIYAPKEEAEFYGVNKPRVVDPLVLINKELVRLTTLIPGLNDYFNQFKMDYKYIGVKQLGN